MKNCNFKVTRVLSGKDINIIANRLSNFTGKVYEYKGTKQDLLKAIDSLDTEYLRLSHIDKIMDNIPVFNINRVENDNVKDKDVSDIYMLDVGSFLDSVFEIDDFILPRNEYLKTVFSLLSRRYKCGICLTGVAGVGKSIFIKSIAKHIEISVVPALCGYRIYKLDLEMLSQTSSDFLAYRQNFKYIVNKCINNKYILIIDQLEVVEDSKDYDIICNVLHEAVENTELKVIISMNRQSYDKTFTTNSLSKKIDTVFINEMKKEEVFEIVRNFSKTLEKKHGVKIGNDRIEDAIYIAGRYMQNLVQPDATMRLLDTASASVSNIEIENNMKNYVKLRKKIEEFKKDYKLSNIIDLKNKEENKRITVYDSNIKCLTTEDIMVSAENMTGIRKSGITTNTVGTINRINSILKDNLFGQEEAIDEMISAIKRSMLGADNPNKPIASFVFAGRTGVGKTHAAKMLAKGLYGSEKKLITYDMSEYSAEHEVARLIGSPAGYIGSTKGGKMVKDVNANPHSIILLDEFEKAHPSIQNVFLQVLEEGRLTDGRGITANFSNTVIIITTNSGMSKLSQELLGFNSEVKTGYERIKRSGEKSIEKWLSPEFRNRITSTIFFKELSEENLINISRRELSILSNRIVSSRYNSCTKISFDKNLAKDIVSKAYVSKYGGRSISRFIEKEVTDTIISKLLENKKEVSVSIKDLNTAA